MKKFLYEGHLGTLFTSEAFLSHDELYCECCGDFDQLVGEFETPRELWELVRTSSTGVSVSGSGGWSLQHVFLLIVSEFELPCNILYDDQDTGSCVNTEEDILMQLKPYIEDANNGLTFIQFVEAVRNGITYCDKVDDCDECCLNTCFDCKENTLTKGKSK